MLDQDAIGQFLIECCICDPSDRWRSETSADLFAAWRRWAEDYGEPVGTQRAFAALLAERGYERERTNRDRRYRGLRLRVAGDL